MFLHCKKLFFAFNEEPSLYNHEQKKMSNGLSSVHGSSVVTVKSSPNLT